MNDYMLLLHGGADARDAMSPEEMQRHMERFYAWMQGLSSAGRLKGGLPLGSDGYVIASDGAVVTDGPFVEGKEAVVGYIIIKANDLDEARELARGCCILELAGSSVEVRPILSIDMPQG